jgi:hypothetical protein
MAAPRLARAHWQFAVVAAAAAALRAIVALGYPPAMFFNDSYNYMTDAVTGLPDIVRANGYPFLLRLLLPPHSLSLITGLQAAMGLGLGVGIYAVLRHRGLPWWGATIPALPVLFDVWELQIEHMIAADTLFTALVTAAIALLCWQDRPAPRVAALAGLLAGCSATVRSVGEPVLVVLVIGMLARPIGWRSALAAMAAGALPIVGYMAWFSSHYGSFELDRASGTFLYSRVSSFAVCSRMKPPAALRPLCDPRPARDREGSQEYLWANDTPLGELTGTNNIHRFTPHIEYLTLRFAERAIVSQPLDYVAIVADDTARAFGWTRFRSDLTGSGDKFRFEATTQPVPWWAVSDAKDREAATEFGGPALGRPAVVQPWAAFLQWYERWAYLRGPFLLAVLLAGLAGIIAAWRALGGLALLPWLAGVSLIAAPPMTAGFSYRYVLAAVPASCLAAGLACAGRHRSTRHPDSSAPGTPAPETPEPGTPAPDHAGPRVERGGTGSRSRLV